MSQHDRHNSGNTDNSILGLSMTNLAGVTVEELLNNKTAVTMMVHYYKILADENAALKTDVNTLRTYVDGYQRKKTYASISAILLAASNILIGFGVNLLTSSNTWPGLATILSGITMIGIGLWFSFKDSD